MMMILAIRTNRREVMERQRKALRMKNFGPASRVSMASSAFVGVFQTKRDKKKVDARELRLKGVVNKNGIVGRKERDGLTTFPCFRSL